MKNCAFIIWIFFWNIGEFLWEFFEMGSIHHSLMVWLVQDSWFWGGLLRDLINDVIWILVCHLLKFYPAFKIYLIFKKSEIRY
ncbi:unnamed protein product [Phytomonas sp. Hart1]|nr:unnamed protein product [Phytomonas sp. Hart1]|eukprot:CCW72077.1 unnamed protein product [Phytomonas sp. isolate Hart1]